MFDEGVRISVEEAYSLLGTTQPLSVTQLVGKITKHFNIYAQCRPSEHDSTEFWFLKGYFLEFLAISIEKIR